MSKLVFRMSASMALLLQLAAVVLLALSSVNGAKIDIINNCQLVKTICVTCCRGATVNCYVLNGGRGTTTINVGTHWPAGVIWGFNGNSGSSSIGNAAKPQANLAEITIGHKGRDYYDISNVNAYNLPMRIAPTVIAGGETPQGTTCTPTVCNIPYNDLATFCQAPNKLTGAPGNGCKNTDGTGNVPTAGTRAFKARCSTSYSYSKDNVGTVFNCKTGSNYQVEFCPP